MGIEVYHYIKDHLLYIFTLVIEHLWYAFTPTLIGFGLAIGIILFLLNFKYKLPRISILSNPIPIPLFVYIGLFYCLFGSGELQYYILLTSITLIVLLTEFRILDKQMENTLKEHTINLGVTYKDYYSKILLPMVSKSFLKGVKYVFLINLSAVCIGSIIGMKGLGQLIYRGITFNRMDELMSGILLFIIIGAIGFNIININGKSLFLIRRVALVLVFSVSTLGLLKFILIPNNSISSTKSNRSKRLKIGVNPTFLRRQDGYPPLAKRYNLDLEISRRSRSNIFHAIVEKEVDIVVAYSTDPQLSEYSFVQLEDDKHFFYHYDAAPIMNKKTAEINPEVVQLLSSLEGRISIADMQEMIFQVTREKQRPKEVARRFLKIKGLLKDRDETYSVGVINIGAKNSMDNEILAYIFGLLIENRLSITVNYQLKIPNTKEYMEYIKSGKIDISPDYTGVMLKEFKELSIDKMLEIKVDPEKAYQYLKENTPIKHGLIWLPRLGFKNDHVMIMRKEDAKNRAIEKISDLSKQ